MMTTSNVLGFTAEELDRIGKFIVAAPTRVSYYEEYARALAKYHLLKGYFVGTRRGSRDVPGESTYLNPLFGLFIMGARRALPSYAAEWLRAAIHPVFDRWVRLDVSPGTNIISSYGYANKSFQKARSLGGKTFLDAGNSHPEQFWSLVKEEHKRWKVSRPPYPPIWNKQGRRMVKYTDYVLSPSRYVADSFTSRGFSESQIVHMPYPVDLSVFTARSELTIPDSVLRVVCTGSVSLRKGFPYLFEAMRLICKERDAILVLTNQVETSMTGILSRYADVPVEWVPPMPHDQLANHLKKNHVFALLSLEDGLARTVTEALACGLPAVVSENTGAKDFIQRGVNGDVVPIRDPAAAATAIIEAHERQLRDGPPHPGDLTRILSYEEFERQLAVHLRRILCENSEPGSMSK
jgi:glycosyltransferase involved in cell wall biosynthesis